MRMSKSEQDPFGTIEIEPSPELERAHSELADLSVAYINQQRQHGFYLPVAEGVVATYREGVVEYWSQDFADSIKRVDKPETLPLHGDEDGIIAKIVQYSQQPSRPNASQEMSYLAVPSILTLNPLPNVEVSIGHCIGGDSETEVESITVHIKENTDQATATGTIIVKQYQYLMDGHFKLTNVYDKHRYDTLLAETLDKNGILPGEYKSWGEQGTFIRACVQLELDEQKRLGLNGYGLPLSLEEATKYSRALIEGRYRADYSF